MTQPLSQTATDADDRRKHLDFIQRVVTRMSAASSSAKSWLLPVVTVTYGYALTRNAGSVALLGLAAVLLFALLDANYLRQELAYRRLYDAVAASRPDVPPFSLDPSHTGGPSRMPGTPVDRSWRRVAHRMAQWVPERDVWLSWSIGPFYGGLIIAGGAVLLASWW